jgi:hypothetical protein
MPPGHTIGRLARPLSTNGAGEASVSVTVPAASSAFALAPAGRNVPRKGLLFFGSATYATLSATTLAVRSVPSQQ